MILDKKEYEEYFEKMDILSKYLKIDKVFNESSVEDIQNYYDSLIKIILTNLRGDQNGLEE